MNKVFLHEEILKKKPAILMTPYTKDQKILGGPANVQATNLICIWGHVYIFLEILF